MPLLAMLSFFLTIAVMLALLFLLLFYTLKNGISPMPTSKKVKRALIKILPDMKGKRIVDLGSGWGNLIFPLACKYKSCDLTGFENSVIPYWFSCLINHHENLKIQRADFYTLPLHDVDMVVCYLHPKAMERLGKKFEEELKPGTYVVSHLFAIPEWKPEKVIEVDDLHQSKVYLYRVDTK